MMSNRYVKVSRKFFESAEWLLPRTFSEQEAWLDMIFLACFANHQIDLGKDGILHLERGEFYYPQRQLAKRWGWPLSKVNRYLARLAEGTNPRIEKIMRETQNETQSETQVETQIAVVRLCNYARYNKPSSESETHIETHIETQNETLNKKGYNNKGDKNTHTQFDYLKFFTHTHEAHAHTPEQMCAVASAIREQVQRGELPEYKSIDDIAKGMIWLYAEYPELMQRFKRPCTRQDFQTISQMCEVEDVKGIVEALANKLSGDKPLNSFLATFKQWAALDYRIKDKARLGNPRYSKLS